MKNNEMINYDKSRNDITIETTPGQRTQSRLIIREPQISDSGNYTCSATNTIPASIYVFVSKGKRHIFYKTKILFILDDISNTHVCNDALHLTKCGFINFIHLCYYTIINVSSYVIHR